MSTLVSELLIPFLQAASVGVLAIAGVFAIRWHRQYRADHMRELWEIEFGGEIKMDAVYGFLHALSGLDRPRSWFDPTHAVIFEHVAIGTDSNRYFIHIAGHMRERVAQWAEEHLD